MAMAASPPILKVENVANVLARLQSSAISDLPERYVWPEALKHNLSLDSEGDHEASLELPVIDISNLLCEDQVLREKTVHEIGLACEEWGFMQIVNHGISDQLYKDVVVQSRKFFHLPVDRKEKATLGPGSKAFSGYTGRWPAVTSSAPWMETLSDSADRMEASVANLCWPESNPEFCKPLEEFWAKLRDIGIEVLGALALYLGLKKSTFSEQFKTSDDHGSSWRLNYYPECPRPDLALGAGPHADPNIMTLLRSDRDFGLQVRKGNRWVDVPLVASRGTVVINVGDTLEALSNGRFKSIEHRVRVTEKLDRISTVYSMQPEPSKILEAPSKLIDEEHPSLYRPFTFGEYMAYIKNSSRIVGKSAFDCVRRESPASEC